MKKRKSQGSEASAPGVFKTVERIGKVGVASRSGVSSYYLQWWDKEDRKMVRVSADTANLEDAQILARKKKEELAKSKRQRVRQRSQRIKIKAAMDEAIKRGGRRKAKETSETMERFARYFQDWLGSKKRAIVFWDQVDARLVSDYVEHLEAHDMKPKSMRHYVGVISSTMRYWNGIDDTQFRFFRVSHPALELEAAEKTFLSLEQSMIALAKAEEMKLQQAAIALTLGAFAGLRLREIAGIKRDDFDAETGLLTITRKKNKHSGRTIPLLPDVAKFIENSFAANPGPYLVTWENLGTQGNNDTMARPLRRVLAACHKATKKTKTAFDECDPKDCRKAFMNWARTEASVDVSALTAYVGHAPISMMDSAYVKWTPEKLSEFVVEPLKAHLEGLRKGQTAKVRTVAAFKRAA